MTAQDMVAIYQALVAAFDGVPVHRSWPQTQVETPAVFFRLLSWQRRNDGSCLTTVLVQLRVPYPAMGDQLMPDALAALLPLGYALAQAEDGMDYDSGAFLRSLRLTRLQDAPTGPQTQFSGLSVQDMLGDTHPLQNITSIALLPFQQQFMETAAITARQQSYLPLKWQGAQLTVKAAYLATCPAQLRLVQAFTQGSQLAFTLHQGGAAKQQTALVQQVLHLPTGFQAQLKITSIP